MAGHSKFHNIKFRKERQDKKRASAIEKLCREIFTAVKVGGPDPKNNARLRHSLQKARSQNVPKDRLEKAFKKGEDKKDTSNFSEERFEGFLGAGAGIIIETLTDNKMRTMYAIKKVLNKHSGNLSNTGCVTHMFQHQGIIHFPISVATEEQMLESAVEGGALDVISENGIHCIYTMVPDFSKVLDSLSKKYGDPLESHIGWVPKEYVIINDKTLAKTVLNIVEALEDLDDVQHVFVNYDITDEIYEALKKDLK